jgi:hypothetical protein
MVGGNVLVGFRDSLGTDGVRVLLLLANDGANVLLFDEAVGSVVPKAAVGVGVRVTFAPAIVVGNAVGVGAGVESGFVVFSPVGTGVVAALP